MIDTIATLLLATLAVASFWWAAKLNEKLAQARSRLLSLSVWPERSTSNFRDYAQRGLHDIDD